MAPHSSEIVDAVIDLCAQVEAQMGALRRDYQHSIYEICTGLNNRITKEMGRLVYHVRRLIDQNGFLYDRVVELEKRDDPERVLRRAGDLNNPGKGQLHPHAHGAETVDAIRQGITRRRISSPYRHAG